MSPCFDTIDTRARLNLVRKIHSCIPETQNRPEKRSMNVKNNKSYYGTGLWACFTADICVVVSCFILKELSPCCVILLCAHQPSSPGAALCECSSQRWSTVFKCLLHHSPLNDKWPLRQWRVVAVWQGTIYCGHMTAGRMLLDEAVS